MLISLARLLRLTHGMNKSGVTADTLTDVRQQLHKVQTNRGVASFGRSVTNSPERPPTGEMSLLLLHMHKLRIFPFSLDFSITLKRVFKKEASFDSDQGTPRPVSWPFTELLPSAVANRRRAEAGPGEFLFSEGEEKKVSWNLNDDTWRSRSCDRSPEIPVHVVHIPVDPLDSGAVGPSVVYTVWKSTRHVYIPGLYSGLITQSIDRLQLVHNSAARVLMRNRCEK